MHGTRSIRAAFASLSLFATAAIAAPPAYQQALVDSDPIVYYQLNEASGDAVNYGTLGASFDAAYLGTPLRNVPSLSGDGALEVDSVDDYLESLSVVPVSLTGNPSFTVEALVRIRPLGSVIQFPPFLHWGPSDGSPDGRSVFFAMSGNSLDRLFVGFYNGGLQSPAGAMPAGQWHHLVWVRDGGGTASAGSTLYVDGVDVTASLVGDPLTCCNGLTPDVGATELRINRARDGEGLRQLQGRIDELALFDRALDPAEALAHYQALGWLFRDGFESGDTSAWSAAVPLAP